MLSLSHNISLLPEVSGNSLAPSHDFKFTNGTNKTCLYDIFANAQRLIGKKLLLYYSGYYTSENSSTKYLKYSDQTADSVAYSSCNSYIDLLKIENIQKLDCMSNFSDDWNGSGGVRFSASAINSFKIILNGLFKQPQIAPTGRNSLFMQYESDNNLLAFEVTESKVEMVYVPDDDYSAAISKTFKNDFVERINDEVELFYGTKHH